MIKSKNNQTFVFTLFIKNYKLRLMKFFRAKQSKNSLGFSKIYLAILFTLLFTLGLTTYLYFTYRNSSNNPDVSIQYSKVSFIGLEVDVKSYTDFFNFSKIKIITYDFNTKLRREIYSVNDLRLKEYPILIYIKQNLAENSFALLSLDNKIISISPSGKYSEFLVFNEKVIQNFELVDGSNLIKIQLSTVKKDDTEELFYDVIEKKFVEFSLEEQNKYSKNFNLEMQGYHLELIPQNLKNTADGSKASSTLVNVEVDNQNYSFNFDGTALEPLFLRKKDLSLYYFERKNSEKLNVINDLKKINIKNGEVSDSDLFMSVANSMNPENIAFEVSKSKKFIKFNEATDKVLTQYPEIFIFDIEEGVLDKFSSNKEAKIQFEYGHLEFKLDSNNYIYTAGTLINYQNKNSNPINELSNLRIFYSIY